MDQNVEFLTTHGWKEVHVRNDPLLRLISKYSHCRMSARRKYYSGLSYHVTAAPRRYAIRWVCILSNLVDGFALRRHLRKHMLWKSSVCSNAIVIMHDLQFSYIWLLRKTYPCNVFRLFEMNDGITYNDAASSYVNAITRRYLNTHSA